MQKNDRKEEKRIECISGIEKVEEKRTHTKITSIQSAKVSRINLRHTLKQRNEMENNEDGNGMAVGA